MGLVQRKTNRCLFLTKLQSRFHAIFLFCPHITSLIVAAPVFQTIWSDAYSLVSNGFSLYLNLNICIGSKNMYHCFTCISFLFSFLKYLAVFNLDCLKSHATIRFLYVEVNSITLVNIFHSFLLCGLWSLSEPHIKDYGPGNERRNCLWLTKSEDF